VNKEFAYPSVKDVTQYIVAGRPQPALENIQVNVFVVSAFYRVKKEY